MLKITDLKVKISELAQLKKVVAKVLRVDESEILTLEIKKKSLDARKADQLHYVMRLVVKLKDESRFKKSTGKIEPYKESKYQIKPVSLPKERPIIVGFGPAGMFAALVLAKAGACPIVFEQGEAVDERTKSVDHFFKTGELNELSNIQFGEGGAGTFSDGKLTTRVKDQRIDYILSVFHEFGANEDVLYDSHPHIGTDVLKNVVKNMRNEIISLGGEIHFNSKMTNIVKLKDQLTQIEINYSDNYQTNHLILALGNSAKDTFRLLNDSKVKVSSKPFSIGFRIEHKQKYIDEVQYKEAYDKYTLPKAEYRLTAKTSSDKGVYTFCMCPGGTVVAATSNKGHVVVNGMSEYNRDKENANSAIIVQVDHTDYGDGLWDGIDFIENIERKAYELGNKTYKAPVQLVEDYINNTTSTEFKSVLPSYPLGTVFSNLNELLPDQLNTALKEAIAVFDRKMNGFTKDSLLTGVETRTSSAIRIDRDFETMESVSSKGIYPIGEGAGYAGGIMSSAIDGLKIAEKIVEALS